MHYLIKIAVTTLLIVFIVEISKRSSFVGAIFASIPLVSVLSILWVYHDTGSISLVTSLSRNIFWMVFPSLLLFLILPILLDYGVNFYVSLLVAVGVTVSGYWGMVTILNFYGVKL
jgi:hypothetical protein